MSGWRSHTEGPSPFHIWPDWQADHEHNLSAGTFCWCRPRVKVVDEWGRVAGLLITHRPTRRQRAHLLPHQVLVAARRARKAIRRDRAHR